MLLPTHFAAIHVEHNRSESVAHRPMPSYDSYEVCSRLRRGTQGRESTGWDKDILISRSTQRQGSCCDSWCCNGFLWLCSSHRKVGCNEVRHVISIRGANTQDADTKGTILCTELAAGVSESQKLPWLPIPLFCEDWLYTWWV
jgi:hypothetical protein